MFSCPIEDLDQFGRDQFPPCSHQGRSFGRGLCGDQGIGQLLFGWRGALNLVPLIRILGGGGWSQPNKECRRA